MAGYGQFCPVARASQVFCERWTALVLRELIAGSTRFNDIQRGVPLMSPSLLSRRLKQLEAEGVISRQTSAGGRGVEYRLTEAGQHLAPLVHGLGAWAQEWADRTIKDDELDVSLLIWDMQRTVRPEQFPAGRTVVEIMFGDQAKGKARWWFVCDGGSVELCPVDPGFEVDLYVTTDLRTLTDIWIGNQSIADAELADRLDLQGSKELRKSFADWLGLSPFAKVKSRRAA